MSAFSVKRLLGGFLATLLLASPGGALAGMPTETPTVSPSTSGPAPATPALVAVKVTREQAVATARKFFAIPAELGEPNANVSQSSGVATWSLNWQSDEKKAERQNIHVEVDASTGAVTTYYRYASGIAAVTELAYTRTEAFAIALQWLEKLAAGYRDAVRFFENPLGYGYYGKQTGYDFHWDRLGGNYPVQAGGINIAINPRTGELESFRLDWQRDAVFKEPAALLERSKADSIYRELVPMMLQYQHFQKPGANEGEWRLVYRPQMGYFPSVNQDGSLLTPYGATLDLATLKEMKVVPAADRPYVKPDKPLTQEEALALAQKVSGRSEAPSNSNYMESGKEQKYRAWEFGWYKSSDLQEGEYNTNVTIDAERGVITDFRNWGTYQPFKEGEEAKVTEAQARESAVAFIRTHRPDLAGSLLLMPRDADPWGKGDTRPPTLGVQFMPMKNSIPVSGRDIRVEMDLRTGAVQSFWSNRGEETQEPYPPAEGLISPGEATAAFLKTQGLELSWGAYGQSFMGKFPSAPQTQAAQLVWTAARTLPTQNIDAKTGAMLDYQGRDLIEASKRPVDIEGHYAQREIELLWARGIFELTGGKFLPNTVITAADAARWLVLARGFQPYLSYDFGRGFAGNAPLAAKLSTATEAPYFGAALQNGIILPADFAQDAAPDSPVSRELFALWAARAMGYGAIAKMPNRIEMAFTDRDAVGSQYANAVAILHGLGIVKGDGSAFHPQAGLTRGGAARILLAVASHVSR